MGRVVVWTEEALQMALDALPPRFTLHDMRDVARTRVGLKHQPATGEGLKAALLRAGLVERVGEDAATGREVYQRKAQAQ